MDERGGVCNICALLGNNCVEKRIFCSIYNGSILPFSKKVNIMQFKFFHGSVAAGEVGASIMFMLQSISVFCVPDIV